MAFDKNDCVSLFLALYLFCEKNMKNTELRFFAFKNDWRLIESV